MKVQTENIILFEAVDVIIIISKNVISACEDKISVIKIAQLIKRSKDSFRALINSGLGREKLN